ncbi:MAG: FAD-binding oxidoreductase [Alphaproteobacteria bacterium]|nr:FAD-binding oxidoreductase [Alphaproteobacteria bacterium]
MKSHAMTTVPVGAPHPPSYWAATALPAPALRPLAADAAADVVIVGGGFTGLGAARDLWRSGTSCIVLEAADAGWGASGRNGGFAVPRYKKGWADLAAAFGHEETRKLRAMILEAIDTIEQTASEFGIACHFDRSGHCVAAHGKDALATLESDVAWLASEGGDRSMRVLGRGETRDAIGAGTYCGGILDPKGAMIHPLSYVRGLATALASRGVPIHVATPATRVFETADGVVVETPNGTVRAKQAIMATNAYTPPGVAQGALDRRVVPVSTSVIATKPLTPNVLASLLPSRYAVSDTKHLMHYFRHLPDGRLMFGGRGDVTGRREDPSIYRGLEEGLVKLYPQLEGTAIDHRWSGMVAVTLDNFPHIGRVSDRIAYAMGYGGRGVALANLLGKYLARLVRGETVDAGPMSRGSFSPIPFHGLRVPMLKLVAGWYSWQDRRALAEAAADPG